MTGLIHLVEFVNNILMVSTSRGQLLFHLVVVDLECAQFEFEVIDAKL